MSADAKAYFDGLPTYCTAAVQTAYDKITSGHYSDAGVYRGLCKDFDEVGEKHPDRKLFGVWFSAVERGEAERPGRQLAEDGIPAAELVKGTRRLWTLQGKSKAERKRRETVQASRADVLVTSTATGEAVQPLTTTTMDEETREITSVAADDGSADATGIETVLDDLGVRPMTDPSEPISARPMDAVFKGVQFAPVIDNAEALLDAVAAELNASPMPGQPARVIMDNGSAFVAMKTAVGRLLEENIIQLSREIEHTARETTARMLREVADELEHSSL